MSYMASLAPTAMLEPVPGLKWKLKEYLEQNDVSAYAIAKDAGLSLHSIYRMTNNHSRTIQFDTIEAIVTSLKKKTGRDVQLSDILELDLSDN